MLLGIYHLLRISNIRVGMIEEPETKLEFQDASKCAVDQRLRNRALLDTKLPAGAIDSSPLSPKSLRQKIGETSKALPVGGGAG